MNEADSVFFVSAGFTVIALVVARFFPIRERLWVFGAWLAHLAAAFAQAWIYLYHYGGGDFVAYSRKGAELGAALRLSPEVWGEVLKLIFLREARLPIEVVGVGSSTGAMSGFTAVACYFFGGETYTCCVVFSFFAYVGTLLIYLALRKQIPLSRGWVFVATCMLPSVVFWSSAPLKESVALTGIGFTTFSVGSASLRSRIWFLPLAIVGITLIALSKPYILVALFAGLTAGGYQIGKTKRSPLLRSLVFLVSVGLLVIGIGALGELFDELALDRVVESAASQQEASSFEQGGSNFELMEKRDKSLVGQILIAPFAIFTALFRPLVFESKNLLMFANSLETSFVGWLALVVLWENLKGRTRFLQLSPVLAFALTFTVVLGLGVGLSTANLGTLSRYRMPLMPFWVVFLLVSRGASPSVTGPRNIDDG